MKGSHLAIKLKNNEIKAGQSIPKQQQQESYYSSEFHIQQTVNKNFISSRIEGHLSAPVKINYFIYLFIYYYLLFNLIQHGA